MATFQNQPNTSKNRFTCQPIAHKKGVNTKHPDFVLSTAHASIKLKILFY